MLHIETPLLESLPLSMTAGRSVWLKMEALQPSGSFKTRGVGRACETYLARGAQRLAYEKAVALEPFHTVLIVVCGGATCTVDQIRAWAQNCTPATPRP